jgi:phenylalanyl-tRNA synthetase beta chain
MDLDFVEKKKNHLSLENRRIFLDIENKSEKVISANYMLIENVTVGESSNWLKKILFFNNIKPVNNFVDISNLVMLKAGQPLHIFDYDLIKNKKITLRSGKENEAFKDLKGRKINLTENDLVAALKEEVIDLLGVIGDQSTSLTEKSKNILVECAFLESKNVETTSKRTQTRTRASEYFSKGANVFLPPEEVFKEFLAICSREIEENINYKVQLDAK